VGVAVVTAVFVAAITLREGAGDDDGRFVGVELLEGSVGARVLVTFGSAQATIANPKNIQSENSKRWPRPQRLE
jgi:hypothetical protein